MQEIQVQQKSSWTMTWLPVLLGLTFLLLLGYGQRVRMLKGQNDFVAFYTGAKLAGTPDLYSRDANVRTIHDLLGFTQLGVTYIRPPFYASLLKPLSFLPYRAAYAIFLLATFSCALWFVIYFSKECRELPLFAALGIPLLVPLLNGQDTPFLLAAVGAMIVLSRKEKDFLAGIALSLCAIKFHLFFFVVGLLIIKRRWRILAGGAAGSAALFAVGFLVAGPDSLGQWIKVLRDPWITPGPEGLPNIHGLVLTLGGDLRSELILTGIVCAGFLWLARRAENFELMFAASLVCGLLTSFHSGSADDILLFPAFVLTLGATKDPFLRVVSAFLLMPIPYFLVFAGSPYSIILPAALFLWLLAAGLAQRSLHRSAVPLSALAPSAECPADNA